jgi:tetratricopeptide (TPR) repeat protein
MKRVIPFVTGMFVVCAIQFASGLTRDGLWSRSSNPSVPGKPEIPDAKWIDPLGRILDKATWVKSCGLIACQLDAARKRHDDIRERHKRGEIGLEKAESDLHVTLAELDELNDLAEQVLPLRVQLERARSHLSADLLAKVEAGTQLVRFSEFARRAWDEREEDRSVAKLLLTECKRQLTQAYEDGRWWLEAHATLDDVSSWRRAEEVVDLLAEGANLTSRLSQLEARHLLDLKELAAVVKDREATRARIVDLDVRLASSTKDIGDARTASRLLEDKLDKLEQEARSREGQLEAKAKAPGVALAGVADLRARLASVDEAALKASRARVARDFYERGKDLMEQARYELAVSYFEAVIYLDPSCIDAYNCRGGANYQLGDKVWHRLGGDNPVSEAYYHMAIADHKTAIGLKPRDPRYPNPYMSLSGIYSSCPQKGFRHVSEAIIYADIACALTRVEDPEARKYHPEARKYLARAYEEAGESPEGARRRVEFKYEK